MRQTYQNLRLTVSVSSYNWCFSWILLFQVLVSCGEVQQMQCSYKGLHVLEMVLQIFSVALIGIPAVNHGMMSVAARTTLVSMAAICFAASRCLSFFIYTHAFCWHQCLTCYSENWTSHCPLRYALNEVVSHATLLYYTCKWTGLVPLDLVYDSSIIDPADHWVGLWV